MLIIFPLFEFISIYHDYYFTTVKESAGGTLKPLHQTVSFNPVLKKTCSYNLAELLYTNWYYKKLYTAKIIQQQSEIIVEKHMNFICKSKGKPQEQTESRRLSVDVGIYKHCHTWLDKTDIIIAWENSRYLATLPLVALSTCNCCKNPLSFLRF